MIGGRVRGRRVVAGAVVALAACSGVVACSGSGETAGSSASASPSVVVSGSASATAEASASASILGEVTAESLSDEELGHIVTSIPEGLNATELEVVRGYVEFDQYTWTLWFAPLNPDSELVGADDVFTDEGIDMLEAGIENREPGSYSEGTVRLAVLSASVNEQTFPPLAVVTSCLDLTGVRKYGAAGDDVTTPEDQSRLEYQYILELRDGRWKVKTEELLSTNECVA